MQAALDLFDKPAPRLAIAFRSGMSASRDFAAAENAGVAIGVVVGELSMPTRILAIPRFLRAGGKLFIDSGAFAEFKTGIEPDFDRVLRCYEFAAEAFDQYDPAQLYVVAPDKVGDQGATLERLARYRVRVRALIEAGCHVIVPLQRGALNAAAMLDAVADVLGTRAFVAGIPSNAEALSIAECATLRHDRFHILGRVQMSAEQGARLHALTSNNPAAHVTADANWLRSRLSDICRLTDNERARRRDEGECGWMLPASRTVAIEAAIAEDTTWAK